MGRPTLDGRGGSSPNDDRWVLGFNTKIDKRAHLMYS